MRYEDYFKRTRMPKDLHGFAEKAIEIAGQAGERKRKFKVGEASALARARMAEVERAEVGATRRVGMEEAGLGRRLGMKEVGLGERLGREQEFARPLQRADIGRVGALTGLREAEAEKVRYGTEFERGLGETLEGIMGAQKELGEAVAGERKLGLSEALREVELREEAEAEAARPLARGVPTAPTRSAERAKPLLERILGYTLPGGSAYSPMRDWLKRDRKEEEYAYPGAR